MYTYFCNYKCIQWGQLQFSQLSFYITTFSHFRYSFFSPNCSYHFKSDSVIQRICTIMSSSYLMIMSPHTSSKPLTEKLNKTRWRTEPVGCYQPLSSRLVLIHSLPFLWSIFQPGTKPVHPTSTSPLSSVFSTKRSWKTLRNNLCKARYAVSTSFPGPPQEAVHTLELNEVSLVWLLESSCHDPGDAVLSLQD